jgi:putative NADH-flavin reductase
MKLFIVGATGRTGRLVIEQAISRGHTITAIVRRPGMLHAHERLLIVVGDPLRCSILAPALVGHDAVISCIGQRSQQDANLLTRAATSILDAMSESQVRRCLVVSQGLLFPSWNPIVIFLRLALKRNVADSAAMERVIRASKSDWTIVRPPRLLEGGIPSGYRVDRLPFHGSGWAMQRADVAAFLLDEAEKAGQVREIVGLTSA